MEKGVVTVKITITGATGFIGQKLAHRLLGSNALVAADGSQQSVTELTLLDTVPAPAALTDDSRVRSLSGDITDSALLAEAIPGRHGQRLPSCRYRQRRGGGRFRSRNGCQSGRNTQYSRNPPAR